MPVEGEELIFTSVPPTFPEYAAIMTAEIAGIAVDQLPEKALVDQKFFQLLTTDGTGKNVYGMIVMTDCVNLKDNTLISIHRELSGFLAGIGGGLFFVPNHASEAVKMHVLKALKRIGGKKIFIPLEVFLGAEEPAGFFGAFPRLPPEPDIEVEKLIFDGKICEMSHCKRVFLPKIEKKSKGSAQIQGKRIQFELERFFGELANHFQKQRLLRFYVNHWRQDGEEKYVLRKVEVLSDPQEHLALVRNRRTVSPGFSNGKPGVVVTGK